MSPIRLKYCSDVLESGTLEFKRLQVDVIRSQYEQAFAQEDDLHLAHLSAWLYQQIPLVVSSAVGELRAKFTDVLAPESGEDDPLLLQIFDMISLENEDQWVQRFRKDHVLDLAKAIGKTDYQTAFDHLVAPFCARIREFVKYHLFFLQAHELHPLVVEGMYEEFRETEDETAVVDLVEAALLN